MTKQADRVAEISTDTGTGTLFLAGAAVGYQTWSKAFGAGGDSEVYYGIIQDNTGEWEVGLGTYLGPSNAIRRDLVLSSSNNGLPTVFPIGQKMIYNTFPAESTLTLRARRATDPALLVMSGPILLENTSPLIRWHETDAVSPLGYWHMGGYGAGNFQLVRVTNPDWSASENVFRVFPPTAVGVTPAYPVRINLDAPVSSTLTIMSTSPQLQWTEADQVDPLGRYRMYVGSNVFYFQKATSALWAAAQDIFTYDSVSNTIDFDTAMRFNASLNSINGNAPQLQFNEIDQVDPAGHFRLYATSGNFYLQKALTAAWGTAETLFYYTPADGIFNFLKQIEVDLSAAVTTYPFSAVAAVGQVSYLLRLNSSGGERIGLYSDATYNLVLRNRANTASNASYLQLSANGTAILSATNGITFSAASGVTFSGPITATALTVSGALTANGAANLAAITADSLNTGLGAITGALNHVNHGGYVDIGAYSSSYGSGYGSFYWNDTSSRFIFNGGVQASSFTGDGGGITGMLASQITHNHGAVGTYRWYGGTGGGDDSGDSVAGSSLRSPYLQVNISSTAMDMVYGNGPSGTWRSMQSTTCSSDEFCVAMWLRTA